MRKALGALAILLLAGGIAWAQTVPEGLGEVARRVRAERAKKDLSHVPFFTNDNMPKATGVVSVVGSSSTAASASAGGEMAGGEAGDAKKGGEKKCDEACWRGRFRDQRSKIRTAQSELDVLQREYNLARTQYYQDPNKAVREQYSNNPSGGGELNSLQQKINDKQAEIEKMQRGLSDLEDELRRSGGDPAWARE